MELSPFLAADYKRSGFSDEITIDASLVDENTLAWPLLMPIDPEDSGLSYEYHMMDNDLEEEWVV